MRAERNRGTRGTPPFARSYHHANRAHSGATGRCRLADSHHDQYCESSVRLQHEPHLNHECYGGSELFRVDQFSQAGLATGSGHPGVQYAAFAWGVPLTGNNWPATMEIEGQPPAVKESDKIAMPLRAVTEDYFKLMGLPMLGGRSFVRATIARRST